MYYHFEEQYFAFIEFFSQKRRERVCKTLDLKVEDTSYSDIMQRLVQRYLFKMERAKDEKESGKKALSDADGVILIFTFE